LAANYTPGYLGVYNADDLQFAPFTSRTLGRFLMRIVGVDDAIYANTGKAILKMSDNGQLIFTANLAKAIGKTEVSAVGLTCFEHDGRRLLYVSDLKGAHIHGFAI
jgi:hypothetical protein